MGSGTGEQVSLRFPRGSLWSALHLFRLPSYGPQHQFMERFWKVVCRRATHHRLFRASARCTQALRDSLRCNQTLEHRVLSFS